MELITVSCTKISQITLFVCESLMFKYVYFQNINFFLQSDLRLMCNNAMIYNRPDTMYYKAAKRLLHAGLKFLSCEKLRQLAFTFPIINQVPPEQLGFVTGSGNTIDDQETNSNDILEENDKKENCDSPSPKRRHCNFIMEYVFN